MTLRHEIMHNTEQTLLHFPGVLCAEDDHFPPSKIKIYASRGCHVVGVTITRELSSIVYSEVRSTEILQLFRSGSDTPATHPVIQLYTKLIETITFFFFSSIFLLGIRDRDDSYSIQDKLHYVNVKGDLSGRHRPLTSVENRETKNVVL